MLMFSVEKSVWGMAAALRLTWSAMAVTGKTGKRWEWTFKTDLGNSGSSAFKTKRNGRDRWKPETSGNELFNSKNETLNAANHQHHGKPVRVRTIEFLCKLGNFFYPRMVLPAFQKRLYTPPQEKRFPEALADFAKFFVALINNRLFRFIANMLIAPIMSDRLSLLRPFNRFHVNYVHSQTVINQKQKLFFGYFFL